MKMRAEHHAELRDRIAEYVAECGAERIAEYAEALKLDESVKDRGKRLRWDLLYVQPQAWRFDWFDRVYPYANDSHVDTALRSVMREILPGVIV